MTRSLRQFMIISIGGFTVLLCSLFYFHLELSEDYLQVHMDTHNRNLAIVLRNSLVAEGLTEMLEQNSERLDDGLLTKLNSILAHELKWVPVIKVKIYSAASRVIFSTAAEEIGESAALNTAVQRGLTGESSSGLVERDHFNEFDNIVETRSIHQQYIPILDKNEEQVLGVFEIYTFTGSLISAVEARQREIFVIIASVIGIFYAALAVIFLSTHRKLKYETRQRHQYLDELRGIHKELENKVAERTAGLEQSEARLQSIMDHVPEAILTCDADFRVLSSNYAAESLFHSEDNKLIGADFNQFYSGNSRPVEKGGIGSGHKVIILKRSDDTVFPADLWIGSLELSESETSYIVVIRDMTDQLKAQEEVESTRQQYFHQEKMAAIGQLAAGILHEVGNPVAAIAGAAAELKSVTESNGDAESDDPVRVLFNQNAVLIDEQTTRLAKITREIADFASPKPRQRELLDLNGLIRSAAQILSYDKRFRSRQIDLQLDRNLPAIVAVSDQLTQVFMNLLINANDASKDDDVDAPHIIIQSKIHEEGVQVIIKDRGEGMSKDILSHAMDPFFTTKPVGKGTGLGLSLCSTIIESHGGQLRIDSEENCGTTVLVNLPIDLPRTDLKSIPQGS